MKTQCLMVMTKDDRMTVTNDSAQRTADDTRQQCMTAPPISDPIRFLPSTTRFQPPMPIFNPTNPFFNLCQLTLPCF